MSQALRFFFTTTLDRPDLSRKLIRVPYPRNAPDGASARMRWRGCFAGTTCVKHRAALSVAYGAVCGLPRWLR